MSGIDCRETKSDGARPALRFFNKSDEYFLIDPDRAMSEDHCLTETLCPGSDGVAITKQNILTVHRVELQGLPRRRVKCLLVAEPNVGPDFTQYFHG